MGAGKEEGFTGTLGGTRKTQADEDKTLPPSSLPTIPALQKRITRAMIATQGLAFPQHL